MRRHRRLLGPALAVAAVAAALVGQQAAPVGPQPDRDALGPRPERVANRVLARALDLELGRARRAKWEMPVSSGVVYTLLEATGQVDRRVAAAVRRGAAAAVTLPPSAPGTQGCQNVFVDGDRENVRVNQDCSLRRQAEEVIAVNPTNPSNLIAGQNDSRVGFNHCGYDWSFDGGRTWGDQIPPFYQFLLADNRSPDACSDPTATFDSGGNAYVGGIVFNVFDTTNGIVVMKSNAPIGGQFYHSPAPLPFQEFRTVPLGVVVSESDPNVFHDKEFIVADAGPGSPKVDNVYATWTRFDFDTGEGVGAHSPIFFSQSTDGGATWSAPIEISGSNPEVCTDFSGSADPTACDQDQGSHPIVGKDGTIYVVFGNGNTPVFGVNQVLFVKCPGTADCSDPASWTAPVKVNDLIGLHPLNDDPVPDPDTGCPPFRQCLPPNGYRVPEFTSMTISVDARNRLYVTWSDFRNGFVPPCDTLDTETARPPCNNDVFYSFSTDGGATWSPERNLTAGRKFGKTAQWQPWSAVTAGGSKLWVAFYDRRFGDCEFTGCNDITLASVSAPASAAPTVRYFRVTTDSMPNLVPANNPVQAGFLGDYMWVAVDARGRVHVVWADTRGRGGTVEEDIYYFRK